MSLTCSHAVISEKWMLMRRSHVSVAAGSADSVFPRFGWARWVNLRVQQFLQGVNIVNVTELSFIYMNDHVLFVFDQKLMITHVVWTGELTSLLDLLWCGDRDHLFLAGVKHFTSSSRSRSVNVFDLTFSDRRSTLRVTMHKIMMWSWLIFKIFYVIMIND